MSFDRITAATSVVLALAVLSSMQAQDAPAPEVTRCEGWVRVEGALRCGVGALSAVLRACPPTRPLRAGARISLVPTLTGCRARVGRLPARLRLRLGQRLPLNQESARGLEALRGIGPKLAQRLVSGRPYARIEEVERVRGIGPRKRAALASQVRVSPAPLLWAGPSRPPLSSSPRRDASARRRP